MRLLFFFAFFISLNSVKAQNTFPYERFTDWQSATVSLLSDSLYQLLDLTLLNLDPTGQQDCSAAVQGLLQQYPTDTLRLHFPAGTFLFTQPLLLRSNLIIEGESPELTNFHFNLGGTQSAIQASGVLSTVQQQVLYAPQKNDTLLICPNHDLQSNEWLYLRCQDAALVTSAWALGTVGQLLQVKSVSGDTLFLHSAIRRTYTSEAPCFIQRFVPKENIKLRCFSIERIDDTAPEQSSSIAFNFVVNSELRSLFSRYCTFAHIALSSCSNIWVTKNYLTEAFDYGGGGRAYGVALQSSTGQCRIEDNIFKHLRHAVLLQSGANGNAIAFNFCTESYWTNSSPLLGTNSAGDLVLHGNYVYANLFEQNVVNNIVIDNSHGSNGPDNLFYRNRALLYGIFFSDQSSPNQLFIGNEVTNTAFPYSLVNYNVQGIGHYEFANNNKGTIVPAGTSLQADTSFAYAFCPDFVPQSMWLKIGEQPVIAFPIPAQNRYETQSYFSTSCGQTDAALNSFALTFDVYPNPTQDFVTFSFSKPVFGKMNIYSIDGKLMRIENLNSKSFTISLSSLPSGLYLWQIEGLKCAGKLIVR
jgi:hypothetical protein